MPVHYRLHRETLKWSKSDKNENIRHKKRFSNLKKKITIMISEIKINMTV